MTWGCLLSYEPQAPLSFVFVVGAGSACTSKGGERVKRVYVCWGPVRGWCGHAHRTIDGALKCHRRDIQRCRKAGGYSDRLIYELTPEVLKRAKNSAGELIKGVLREEARVFPEWDEEEISHRRLIERIERMGW